MKTPLVLTAAAGLVLVSLGLQPAAQASPAPGAARSCFYSNQVSAYQPAGPRTIYVRASGRRVFRIDLYNDCPVRTGGSLLVEPVTGPICGPLDLNLSVVEEGYRQACHIEAVTALTPMQAAALPRDVRP